MDHKQPSDDNTLRIKRIDVVVARRLPFNFDTDNDDELDDLDRYEIDFDLSLVDLEGKEQAVRILGFAGAPDERNAWISLECEYPRVIREIVGLGVPEQEVTTRFQQINETL